MTPRARASDDRPGRASLERLRRSPGTGTSCCTSCRRRGVMRLQYDQERRALRRESRARMSAIEGHCPSGYADLRRRSDEGDHTDPRRDSHADASSRRRRGPGGLRSRQRATVTSSRRRSASESLSRSIGWRHATAPGSPSKAASDALYAWNDRPKQLKYQIVDRVALDEQGWLASGSALARIAGGQSAFSRSHDIMPRSSPPTSSDGCWAWRRRIASKPGRPAWFSRIHSRANWPLWTS